MKIKTLLLLLLATVMLLSLPGCGPFSKKQWWGDPNTAIVENEQFSIRLTPQCSCSSCGCVSFIIEIANKTDKNINVNWDKTLYVAGDQAYGGFVFEDYDYKSNNIPKSPDIIQGKSTFIKEIYPIELLVPQSTPTRHNRMSEGANGAYVSLSIDGKEVQEFLLVYLNLTKGNMFGINFFE